MAYDFDRVRMSDNINPSFRKGEFMVPAYAGRSIRFNNGISEVLEESAINWCLSTGDGKQFIPCLNVPKTEPQPTIYGLKAPELPPPPPGIADIEIPVTEAPAEAPQPQAEEYPGQNLGLRHITKMNAKMAIKEVENATSTTELLFYEKQERALGEIMRKSVLNAIADKRADLK